MAVRVLWPREDYSKFKNGQSGLIVGWQNSPCDFVVATLLPWLDVELARHLLETGALLQGRESNSWLKMHSAGGLTKSLKILGTCNAEPADADALNVRISSPNPHDLLLQKGESTRIQVIFYDPPNAKWLHYYSLEPMELNLLRQSRFTVISAEHEPDLVLAQKECLQLKENIMKHAQGQNQLRNEPADLSTALQQVNISHPCSQLLRKNAQILFPEAAELFKPPEEDSGVGKGRVRRLSVSAKNLGIYASQKALPSSWSRVLARSVVSARWCLVYGVLLLRLFAELILFIFAAPGKLGLWVFDLSTTAMQLQIMARTLAYYPEQYIALHGDPGRRLLADYNVEYVRFYNSVWLLVNDRLLGYALSQWIFTNRRLIISGIKYLMETFFGSQFERTVQWLMHWPGGLKLHDELALFIGKMVVYAIQVWQYALGTLCAPALNGFITFVAWAGIFGGLSLQIAMVSDLMALVTLQVYLFYMGSAKMYRGMLQVVASLFRLFRGKKYNVLRSRVDYGDFDLVQLMMGTLIFTILTFLLPTVAAFYFAFTSMRAVLVLVQALAEMVLMFLNHFPLFILMLRLKSPRRIPGGICFELLLQQPRGANTRLRMHSQPLTMSKIFRQYVMLAQRFSKHYFSFSVIFVILSGGHISIKRTRLYSLFHSMLPAERTTVAELWAMLVDLAK